MAKISRLFSCTQCDTQYPAWQGRCSECQAWGTIVEAANTEQSQRQRSRNTRPAPETIALADVKGQDRSHRPTGVNEFDRVLSGGIVDGSLILLGGEPGVGKSTLVLQVAAGVAQHGTVLYVSGEESKEQLKLRYDRLGLATQNVQVLTETNVDTIIRAIEKLKPTLTIVDSVQTATVADIPGEAGGVTQIKAVTVQLLETAKRTGTSIVLVGHVTKEGIVAGPRMLEHLVDTVIYLEGDEHMSFRLLRTVKHRFGVTDEVGVFVMTEKGLEAVANPSELFLLEQRTPIPGTVVTAILEGTRPFLVEVQALVTQTVFGYPRRLASGMELGRLELLLAVLTKRAGLKLGNQDVHINLVGGLKVKEPAIDLAVALAVASGLANVPLPEKLVAIGEIGLGGEIRPVPRLDQRLSEAAKLGFTTAVIPNVEVKAKNIQLQTSSSVGEAIDMALGK